MTITITVILGIIFMVVGVLTGAAAVGAKDDTTGGICVLLTVVFTGASVVMMLIHAKYGG